MKELAIISNRKGTSLALQHQLKQLLGKRVNVQNYYLDGNLDKVITADLILITSSRIYQEASAHIDSRCPQIIARRSINHHEVEQLFEIPAGTEVLLVNDMASSAHETIALLMALGIDHIRYYPCAPELQDYPRLPLAITPGEEDLVPGCVEKVINIKSRIIDITTLVEVLDKLGLLDESANLLSANYLRSIIKIIKKSRQIASASSKVNNQLQTIINTVYDGIIAVDDTNCVAVFNPIAEELLGIPAQLVIGKEVDGTIEQILQHFNNESVEKETFITFNNHHMVMNGGSIHAEGGKTSRVYTFKDVSEIQRLEEELRRKFVGQQHIARYTLDQIRGESASIQEILKRANKMAYSNSPILIQGESGTGKELLAQGIHNTSLRKKGPFVAVNFAALTESLLESELFGYEEGAFTGARKGGAAGLFEQAHKGTIFLDEIGDAPLSFQVKLLRVLQERQVRRVGGGRLIPIDVRVITATNRDLKVWISKGLFRQDLYYRLNVLPLKIPALRQRKQDIILLAKIFYEKYFMGSTATDVRSYFHLVVPYFLAYDWPGNIRELQNVVEYLFNISPESPPTPDLLPEELLQGTQGLWDEKNLQDNNIKQEISRVIGQYNQQKKAIGRRTVAILLHLPESTIRRLLCDMEAEGRIHVGKGRQGLCLCENE